MKEDVLEQDKNEVLIGKDENPCNNPNSWFGIKHPVATTNLIISYELFCHLNLFFVSKEFLWRNVFCQNFVPKTPSIIVYKDNFVFCC